MQPSHMEKPVPVPLFVPHSRIREGGQLCSFIFQWERRPSRYSTFFVENIMQALAISGSVLRPPVVGWMARKICATPTCSEQSNVKNCQPKTPLCRCKGDGSGGQPLPRLRHVPPQAAHRRHHPPHRRLPGLPRHGVGSRLLEPGDGPD